MAKLGFLGLGLMGGPMARNLIKAGHDVALWSNTAEKAVQIAKEAGGKACGTPAEVAQHSECVFLCVGNSEMSENVILGPNGVKAGGRKGLIVVDASTVSPKSSRHVNDELAKAGIDFLGAPCTGSTPGAINGTLTFMVGGDEKVFEKTKPWLEVMGKKLLFPGDAQLENWSWALGQAGIKDVLRDVDVYKVGHHGSRNATPKELWKLFGKRGDSRGLTTMMSTSAGVYGRSEEGKVPSVNLVKALKGESALKNTQDLKGAKGPIILEIE